MLWNERNSPSWKSFFLVAAAAVLAANAVPQAKAQSFNCRQSGLNLTEHAICQSRDLSEKDEELDRLWGLLTEADRRSMRQGQRRWRGSRDRCGSNHACISRKYDTRIVDLLETMDEDDSGMPHPPTTRPGTPGVVVSDRGLVPSAGNDVTVTWFVLNNDSNSDIAVNWIDGNLNQTRTSGRGGNRWISPGDSWRVEKGAKTWESHWFAIHDRSGLLCSFAPRQGAETDLSALAACRTRTANTPPRPQGPKIGVNIALAMAFISFDVRRDRADPGYPRNMDCCWPGLWTTDVSAALTWTNGKAQFFRDDEYVRYDITSRRADPGYPRKIDGNTWPGLWTHGIDAAFNNGNGKAYFFKAGQYIRYDLAADRADPGYPKWVDDNTWPGLPALGPIDSAVNAGNGKVYFFSGTNYLRYDIASDSADPGYPRPINDTTWPGVWTGDITMAVAAHPGKMMLFHPR